MVRTRHEAGGALLATLLATLCATAGCRCGAADESSGESTESGGGATRPGAPPLQRDGALELLRTVNGRLEAGEHDGMELFFAVPTGFDTAGLRDELPRLLAKREISSAGLEVLAAHARWGKAQEVFGAERAARFVEKFGVTLDRCDALQHGIAEVIFCRFPQGDRIVRLNNVGKLAEEE